MTLEEKIAVMQACRDGKKIQSFEIGTNNGWLDTPTGSPAWDWSRKYYRVKPIPQRTQYNWYESLEGTVFISVAGTRADGRNQSAYRWVKTTTETVEVKA